MYQVLCESNSCHTSLNPWLHLRGYLIPTVVWWNVVVNGSYGTQAFHRMVYMRYAKLKMPSWKTRIVKAIRAIPTDQIRDLFLLIFILIGLVIGLVSPLWLSFHMPTGT